MTRLLPSGRLRRHHAATLAPRLVLPPAARCRRSRRGDNRHRGGNPGYSSAGVLPPPRGGAPCVAGRRGREGRGGRAGFLSGRQVAVVEREGRGRGGEGGRGRRGRGRGGGGRLLGLGRRRRGGRGRGGGRDRLEGAGGGTAAATRGGRGTSPRGRRGGVGLGDDVVVRVHVTRGAQPPRQSHAPYRRLRHHPLTPVHLRRRGRGVLHPSSASWRSLRRRNGRRRRWGRVLPGGVALRAVVSISRVSVRLRGALRRLPPGVRHSVRLRGGAGHAVHAAVRGRRGRRLTLVPPVLGVRLETSTGQLGLGHVGGVRAAEPLRHSARLAGRGVAVGAGAAEVALLQHLDVDASGVGEGAAVGVAVGVGAGDGGVVVVGVVRVLLVGLENFV